MTELTVNERVGVPRKTLCRFRALLHALDRHGPAGRRWGRSSEDSVLGAALGFAHFVWMVTPEAGAPLVAQARSSADRHGMVRGEAGRPTRTAFRQRSAQGLAPLDRWWSPAEPPITVPNPILIEIEVEKTAAAERKPAALFRSGLPLIGRPRPADGGSPSDTPAPPSRRRIPRTGE